MIRRRFSIFRGVGEKKEREIWQAGVTDWSAFLAAGRVPGLTPARYAGVADQIPAWHTALETRDPRFFAGQLDPREHWNLFGVFGDAVRYLDIETTGLSPASHGVTMVGIYDGRQYRVLIRDRDLTAAAVAEALEGCKLLVTFFGRGFDVPFLSETYPELQWNFPHFDLCFAGRKLGFRGGLKRVEVATGIERPDAIRHVDGFEAVRLWYAYQRGDKNALDLLVQYNEADTRNLARLAPIIYEGLCRSCRG